MPHHHVDASLGAHLGSGRTEAGILASAQGANQAVERAAGNYTFNAAGWEQGNHALLPLQALRGRRERQQRGPAVERENRIYDTARLAPGTLGLTCLMKRTFENLCGQIE